MCSPAFPSLNFRGVHASCTLIAIYGAFKFLDRIHPEFSRSFQIVTTLLKKKKKITHKFLFCTFKARMVLYRGMCGLAPSRVSLVKKRSETSSLCQKSSLRRCLTTDRSSVCMRARTHTHTHTHNIYIYIHIIISIHGDCLNEINALPSHPTFRYINV